LIHFLCIKKNNIHQIKFDAHEDQKQRMRKFVFMNFSIGHKAECECESERERERGNSENLFEHKATN
jgi:hypothetical protein